jgi:hypothetical protein
MNQHMATWPMAMAITMRITIVDFCFATEVTQDTRAIVKWPYQSHVAQSTICPGFKDTARMSVPSRGTCQVDLAADPDHKHQTQTQTQTPNAKRQMPKAKSQNGVSYIKPLRICGWLTLHCPRSAGHARITTPPLPAMNGYKLQGPQPQSIPLLKVQDRDLAPVVLSRVLENIREAVDDDADSDAQTSESPPSVSCSCAATALATFDTKSEPESGMGSHSTFASLHKV